MHHFASVALLVFCCCSLFSNNDAKGGSSSSFSGSSRTSSSSGSSSGTSSRSSSGTSTGTSSGSPSKSSTGTSFGSSSGSSSNTASGSGSRSTGNGFGTSFGNRLFGTDRSGPGASSGKSGSGGNNGGSQQPRVVPSAPLEPGMGNARLVPLDGNSVGTMNNNQRLPPLVYPYPMQTSYPKSANMPGNGQYSFGNGPYFNPNRYGSQTFSSSPNIVLLTPGRPVDTKSQGILKKLAGAYIGGKIVKKLGSGSSFGYSGLGYTRYLPRYHRTYYYGYHSYDSHNHQHRVENMPKSRAANYTLATNSATNWDEMDLSLQNETTNSSSANVCLFPMAQQDQLTDENGTKIAEILFKCHDNETCCELDCCDDTRLLMFLSEFVTNDTDTNGNVTESEDMNLFSSVEFSQLSFEEFMSSQIDSLNEFSSLFHPKVENTNFNRLATEEPMKLADTTVQPTASKKLVSVSNSSASSSWSKSGLNFLLFSVLFYLVFVNFITR